MSAYNDGSKYCANIVDTQLKNNEVILSGEILLGCIQEYRSDLTFFLNGRSVCLTELKGTNILPVNLFASPVVQIVG